MELQSIRDETETKIVEIKDDVDRRYQKKLADAEANSNRNIQYSSNMREEIHSYKSKIDDLQTDLQTAQNKITSLECKLSETEDKLKKVNGRYDVDR
jgi:chromosome segregation ATPase